MQFSKRKSFYIGTGEKQKGDLRYVSEWGFKSIYQLSGVLGIKALFLDINVRWQNAIQRNGYDHSGGHSLYGSKLFKSVFLGDV